MWKILQERKSITQTDQIYDITSGRKYQEMRSFTSEPTNVTLLMNTDGVQLFKSSSVSMWPIWIVIGASLSEPHTSELNGRIFLIYICIYICMYRTSYVQCTRTCAACGQKACDLTTRAILDTSFCFKFRVFSLLVVNMDTSSTSRRPLKPSEDKEDRLRRRREREKARHAAETAKERQERLAKRRERDRARRSTEANNKRRERERAQRVAETDKQKQERLRKRRERDRSRI